MNDFRSVKRVYNKARKEIAKQMEANGFRIAIWTKQDKGRTIVQVFGKDAGKLETLADHFIAKANDKYGAKLVHPCFSYTEQKEVPHQRVIKHFGVEKYHDGEFTVTIGG